MSEVAADRKRGVTNVNLRYEGGRRIIVVSLKPNPSKGRLDCTKVRAVKGKKLTGDEKWHFIAQAEREFMAVLAGWLKPKPSHVQVSSLAERVELSFAYTLATCGEKYRARICPLGYEDIRVLQMLAKRVAKQIKDLRIEAKAQFRKMPAGYLDDTKTAVIADWRKDTPCSDELRNFYSSVLGRAFAWKRGRIPREQYAEAMKYLPGIKLAFGQK